MKKLIIASNNKHKIAEITEMLKGRFSVLSMEDAGLDIEIKETGATFEENAMIKARVCFNHTGIACLADDSGIAVDALNGAPGVHSAEYAQRFFATKGDNSLDKVGHYSHNMSNANVSLLLKNMLGIKDRAAKFVCVMAFVDDKNEILSYGKTCGQILEKPIGNNGFGYDPIFYSSELKECFAIASQEAKNSVSHRRRALESFVDKYSKI